MTTHRGNVTLLAFAAAAVALITIELALGARSYGQPQLADPCTTKPAFKGGGLDGAVQRFALSALNGAACQLHTSREELVLSFVPAAHTKKIRWDHQTIDHALQAGLTRAAHDLAGQGLTGQALAFALQTLVAPTIEWFLNTD